jgi:hypothetical protein
MTAIVEGLVFIAIGILVVFLIVKAVQNVAGDENAD